MAPAVAGSCAAADPVQLASEQNLTQKAAGLFPTVQSTRLWWAEAVLMYFRRQSCPAAAAAAAAPLPTFCTPS